MNQIIKQKYQLTQYKKLKNKLLISIISKDKIDFF